MHTKRHGFSLVELSIVLVILGLLTGGILAGQSLIRASELRAVSTKLSGYHAAFYSFRDKYMGMPGDLINAGSFWGYANTAGANGTCANPGTDTGTGTQTCDGDGDSQIISSAGNRYHETFRFFQHLANAGLIEGTYTGVQASANSSHSVAGSNVPAGPLPQSAFYIAYYASSAASGSWWANSNGNLLRLGASRENNWPYNPLFTPADQWNIDTKMDDGKPATGNLFSWYNTDCNTSNDPATADYKLTNDSAACIIFFRFNK